MRINDYEQSWIYNIQDDFPTLSYLLFWVSQPSLTYKYTQRRTIKYMWTLAQINQWKHEMLRWKCYFPFWFHVHEKDESVLLAGSPVVLAVEAVSETLGLHTLFVTYSVSKLALTLSSDWTMAPRITRRSCGEKHILARKKVARVQNVLVKVL